MYGTLLFVSDKKYKKDKVLQILQQHCYDAVIPETLFGHLESDIVKEWFNAAKPPEFIELMNEKKIEELKAKKTLSERDVINLQKYEKRKYEYNLLKNEKNIKAYFDLQEDFCVKNFKVYTTKNILGGKYKSISFGIGDDFNKLLTNKNGRHVDVCKKEELADSTLDAISIFFDYDNNQWIKLKQALVVNDGEEFDYQEALKRARKAKRIRKKMFDTIKSLDGARYCYGLIYEV